MKAALPTVPLLEVHGTWNSIFSSPYSHTIEEEPTIKISEITDAELQYTTKRARHHFFHLQIEFISALLEASSILKRKGLRTKTENSII